jgi:hypothetical protein
MIETLLGGLLGGAFRLAPEILKWLDRKGERGHELAMQDKALEFEKIRGAQRMAEIGASAEAPGTSVPSMRCARPSAPKVRRPACAGQTRCRSACDR